MPSLFAIAAIGTRGQLGMNGRLPWHDKTDLYAEMRTSGLSSSPTPVSPIQSNLDVLGTSYRVAMVATP